MNMIFILKFILLILLCAKFGQSDYGLITITKEDSTSSLEVCCTFNPLFANFSNDLKSAKSYKIYDKYPNEGCERFKESFTDGIAFVKRKNCDFAVKALNIQSENGKGVVIVSEQQLTSPGVNDSTWYNKINITVALISKESYEAIKVFTNGAIKTRIQQYSPDLPNKWDPDSIIMWFLAITIVAIGAWFQRLSILSKTSKKDDNLTANNSTESEDEDLDITVTQAVIFFAMCSVSILLMYFFYNYLVYVIIGIFCYASSMALFDLVYPIFGKSSCFTKRRLPANILPCCNFQPPIFGVLLYLVCAGFAVIWAVYRKASCAWILQDILGAVFCIFMIKQIKLKSFKISTIILVLFFVYDIFYVFITPLFTKDKQSIMVHVATGGNGQSSEELPMLFKLPKLINTPFSKCASLAYSMLGYGDVILPGLHVGFCAAWDIHVSNNLVKRHAYYIAALVGYGLGLILTFIGLYLMSTGQPALLYLTPCCLLSTLFVALKRNEVKLIWKGLEVKKSKQNNSNNNPAVNGTEEDALLPSEKI